MLKIEHLKVGFKGRVLIEDVNFNQEGGVLVALLGRNGTGKSTLLRTIIGLVKPQSGDVKICGNSIFKIKSTQRAKLIAFVSTESVNVAHLRVYDVVAMGRSPYNSFSGALSQEDINIVQTCLEKVGMSEFANVCLDRLSDGERQRVMIARALAQESKMIILDEPTAFLDLPNRVHIIKLLKELSRDGKLIILSTHELNLAKKLADILWVVDGGKLHRGEPGCENVSGVIENMMEQI